MKCCGQLDLCGSYAVAQRSMSADGSGSAPFNVSSSECNTMYMGAPSQWNEKPRHIRGPVALPGADATCRHAPRPNIHRKICMLPPEVCCRSESIPSRNKNDKTRHKTSRLAASRRDPKPPGSRRRAHSQHYYSSPLAPVFIPLSTSWFRHRNTCGFSLAFRNGQPRAGTRSSLAVAYPRVVE
jgi:hypothetical protein